MSNPTLHTCSVSGETSTGKHYLLQTTEGTETVCPEALFHNGADRRLAMLVVDLKKRVGDLEEQLGAGPEEKDPAPGRPAAKTAAPARKTAARKSTAKGGR